MRLIEALKNSKYTENGAEAYASTLNKVYDMFVTFCQDRSLNIP